MAGDYPTALAQGWRIAAGVIEGACRHLVKDRMDLTGARWGRAVPRPSSSSALFDSNSDFEDYRQ